MRGFVSLLSHVISRMGDLLRTVSYLSSVTDFRGRIVWCSVPYSRYTDALLCGVQCHTVATPTTYCVVFSAIQSLHRRLIVWCSVPYSCYTDDLLCGVQCHTVPTPTTYCVVFSAIQLLHRRLIVWCSVPYSCYTDDLFTTIFPLSEAALAAASRNAQWRYKFQKQIYLALLFVASYGTVECEFNWFI
jgi:hypothetical protein